MSEPYNIRGVPAPLLARLWPFAEPYVKRALDHASGEIAAEDLRSACEKRDVQLWLVAQGSRVVGAATTEIVRYPQAVHAVVLTVAGSGFDAWVGQLDGVLAAWAVANGAVALEAHVRRGMVSKLAPHGWRHLHSVVVKKLDIMPQAGTET